jgi:site-specific DNA-cytosine methylase
MKHATIIPLIGGETLAEEAAFGTPPNYLLSYKPFENNDAHLLNYYNQQGKDVPYFVLDDGKKHPYKVDVVSSVCPCAGLSMLSKASAPDNPLNDWMATAAEYVLGKMKPLVYWGENAPAFATTKGELIRERIRKIGVDNGYSFSIYRTKSLFHGVPQIRERSFYFFWRGNKIPLLNYYKRERPSIEDLILSAKGNTQREVHNTRIPTENPYYRYILEEMHPGFSHRDFQKFIPKTVQVLDYVEKHTDYTKLAKWMDKNGFEKEARHCRYRVEKLNAGKGFMKREIIIPHDYIGAFVGHLPSQMTHPVEDRFLNYRECMTIMGLPQDFELLNPKRQLNHICQNVPVLTAQDMATEVLDSLNNKREWVKVKRESEYIMQRNHTETHEVIREAEPAASLNSFLENA